MPWAFPMTTPSNSPDEESRTGERRSNRDENLLLGAGFHLRRSGNAGRTQAPSSQSVLVWGSGSICAGAEAGVGAAAVPPASRWTRVGFRVRARWNNRRTAEAPSSPRCFRVEDRASAKAEPQTAGGGRPASHEAHGSRFGRPRNGNALIARSGSPLCLARSNNGRSRRHLKSRLRRAALRFIRA